MWDIRKAEDDKPERQNKSLIFISTRVLLSESEVNTAKSRYNIKMAVQKLALVLLCCKLMKPSTFSASNWPMHSHQCKRMGEALIKSKDPLITQ